MNFVPEASLGTKSVRTTPPGMSTPRTCDIDSARLAVKPPCGGRSNISLKIYVQIVRQCIIDNEITYDEADLPATSRR